jgi:hypothetical protein
MEEQCYIAFMGYMTILHMSSDDGILNAGDASPSTQDYTQKQYKKANDEPIAKHRSIALATNIWDSSHDKRNTTTELGQSIGQ